MTLYGNVDTSDDVLATLPNGSSFVLTRPYTAGESRGVLVLAIVSCISVTSVAGLLLAIAVSAFNTRTSKAQNLFVRSHVAAYFISLLLCEVAQAVGSIMSIRWVNQMAVSYEPYCTVQGVMKHISDVGTAYWSMIIALNTFWILFLRWKLKRYVLVAAMFGGWSVVGAIVSTGPASLQQVSTGPFYAISGYWCWVSNQYPSERITLDYMIMFLSAVFCFIMYTLIFFRLRGNIMLHGWRLSFRCHGDLAETAPKSVDTHVINIAKGMLLYPVAYTILLLPIAICRFAEWTGHEVPFAVTIFSDAIFLLSGFVNVILFLTTRRVLPVHSVFPRGVSQLFYRTSDPRSSSYTASSDATDMEKSTLKHSLAPLSALPSAAPSVYVIGSAKSDAEGSYMKSPYSSVMERSPLSSEHRRLIRSSAPLSTLPSAAPSQYTATSPIGVAEFEAYDQISLDSAGADRRSFTQEADIVSAPYYTSYQISRVESPVAPVRPVVLSYQPATLPHRLSSVTPMAGPNGDERLVDAGGPGGRDQSLL